MSISKVEFKFIVNGTEKLKRISFTILPNIYSLLSQFFSCRLVVCISEANLIRHTVIKQVLLSRVTVSLIHCAIPVCVRIRQVVARDVCEGRETLVNVIFSRIFCNKVTIIKCSTNWNRVDFAEFP
jgi:hypothetical protein